jgi:hypothetical protein
MGAMETILVIGVVGVAAYFILVPGALQNLGIQMPTAAAPLEAGVEAGGGGPVLLGGEIAEIGWKKKNCCRCKVTSDNDVICKIGPQGTEFVANSEGDLDDAFDKCKEDCIITGDKKIQKLKAVSENCYTHPVTKQKCWRSEVGGSISCAKGSCEDAREMAEAADSGDVGRVQSLQKKKKCAGRDTCNTVKGGYKKCRCDCIGDTWQIGPGTPCSACKSNCNSRRASRNYASPGYIGGFEYTGGGFGTGMDSLKFSMLGRQAARAYRAVPESYDYEYAPNNYDPFQLEQGSMRIAGA